MTRRAPTGSYHSQALLMLVMLSLLVLTGGCGPRETKDMSVLERLETGVDRDRIERAPTLKQRVTANAFGFFRLVNIPFAQGVCQHFKRTIELMPAVNLHGDAHLEQFAVSDEGFGLVDFDDASTGPVVIDLVRFATSIQLACHARGWDDQAAPLVDAFLDTYKTTLENPDHRVPEPRIVQVARRDFSDDPEDFLRWTDGLMKPFGDPLTETRFKKAFDRYRVQMQKARPELNPDFFEIKRAGRLTVGIGSALDLKFLIRVEGPTDEDADDIVLEAKEVRDLGAIPCIASPKARNALRVIVGQSRISTIPRDFVAQVPRGPDSDPDEHTLWIQAWLANYKELDIDTLTSPDELREVVVHVAVQLSRGHTRHIAAPFDDQLRSSLLDLLNNKRVKLRPAIDHMTQATIEAWRRTREAIND